MAENELMEVQIIESTSALEAMERAQTDVAISTAKRYPMHTGAAQIKRFQAEGIAMATINEETAASCLYSLPRGGKAIQGRSVRLAEMAAAAYGNIKMASRIIEIGERDVVAQGACHDLERNVSNACEVRRRITDKSGRRYNDDMILVTCNAAASIALRNAILKVIPAALVEPIYQAARTKAIGGAATMETRQVKCLEAFALMGIFEERVLARVDRPTLALITEDDLATLIGLYNAIRTREVTPEEAFPPIADEGTATEKLAAALGGKKAKPQKAKEEMDESEPTDEEWEKVEKEVKTDL